MKNILIVLLAWNTCAFLTYGYDKSQAEKRAWRVSEKTLLLMAYCGAGLGSLLGGCFFHHKTRKGYFHFAWLIGIFLDLLLILGIYGIMKK